MPLSIGNIVAVAFQLYSWLIFIRVLLSWIPHNPYHPILRFVYEITEPILAPMRRLLPPTPGFPLDISPILAIFLLQFIQRIVFSLLGRFL